MENYPNKTHEISELTPYCSELASWQNYLGDSESQKAALRALFDKYDIFRPTNNILAWNSSISAKNYRVIISQDKTFTNIEREYVVSAGENSVIFENPYSGTYYYWQVIATKNDDSLVYSDIFNFSTAALPRTVYIDGVSNTRDLGGNVGLGGKKASSRIIIMAGQSNAGGVGHFRYLEDSLDEDKLEEIISGYGNVLITGYSNANITGDIYADVDGFNGFKKVNASRYTNTSGSIGTFGFEVGLADRLSKVFPDETTYIVKYAYGGSSLNYDWISPSSHDVPVVPGLDTSSAGHERGWLYTGLVESLTSAITAISEKTNTLPMVEALMWMQGESDAVFADSLNAYLSSFNNMMNDFTTTFADNISYKFALYDAAICETANWKYALEINAIKRSRIDENNIYLDTNERITTSFEPIGIGTDISHYDAACYIDLGHMFADTYLTKILNNYSPSALEIEPVNRIVIHQGQTIALPVPIVTLDDVEVDAKLTYYAQQYKVDSNTTYSYFKVNKDNTITASTTRTGETKLRITAYYQNEVRTILIPVEVVE